MKRVTRQMIVICTVCLTVWSSVSARPVIWPPNDAARSQVQKATSLLDQLLAMVPETADSVDDLAEALDYDFGRAAEFVQADIAFEPYQGVLRGPQGTAVIGAGNAWDQAVLLAAIIRAMGGDAQLVQGKLNAADAKRLLAGSFRQADKQTGRQAEDFDMDKLKNVLASYDQHFLERTQQHLDLLAKQSSDNPLAAKSQSISTQLQALLQDAGVPLAGTAAASELIQALAADYVWVRFREGPGDSWQDLHPAFYDQTVVDVTPEKYIDETVPQEYLHRVALQLFIERQSGGGNIETIAIMKPYERPAANLAGQKTSLAVGPLSFGPASSSQFIVPMLNGRLAPGALAVTKMGMTADPADLGTGAGDYFATLSSSMAGALEKLGATGDDEGKAAPALLSVLLKVTIITPGKADLEITRELASLSEASIQFPSLASFNMTLDVATGRPNQMVTTRKLLNHGKDFIQAIPVLLAIGEGQVSYQDASKTPEFKRLDEAVWPDYDLLSGAILPAAGEQQSPFRAGPLLVSRVTLSDPKRGALTVSDILNNPVTVLTLSDDGAIRINPAQALRQGVRETLLESDLMYSSKPWSERVPGKVISDIRGLQDDPRVSSWSENARQALARDLEHGYVVAPVKDSEPYWWRVNPKTGQSLGMGVRGGQEVAEYVVMVIGAGIGSYMFKLSVESCDETYANNQEMADCCIVGNLLATWGSSAAMGAAGGLPSGPAAAYLEYPFATSAGYIFSALSFETSVGLASDVLITSPIVDSVCKQYINSQ